MASFQRPIIVLKPKVSPAIIAPVFLEQVDVVIPEKEELSASPPSAHDLRGSSNQVQEEDARLQM